MSIANVLGICTKAGITLSVESNELKVSAAKGAVTPEILALLREHKQALIAHLNNWSQQQTDTIPDIKPRSQFNEVPLSFAQQRLWFIDQMGEGSLQYNSSGTFQLAGEIDLPLFKRAVVMLVRRHEVLRTNYELLEDEPRQVIKEVYLPLCDFYDLSGLNPQQKRTEIQAHVDKESAIRFDLSQDLMLRFRVFKLQDNEHLILYTLHHIACDGRSKRILEAELRIIYQALRDNRENTLPALEVQYADYALWQRDWLSGDVLKRQLGYWQKQLAELPQLHNLPLDKPRPEYVNMQGKGYNLDFSKPLSEKVRSLCEQNHVTLYMFLQTAFALLIGRYSNSNDVVIGSPTEGRPHQSVENLMGFFINSLVLRTDLSGEPTFSELLQRNKKVILDGFANQHIPFEMLVEEIHPERHLNYNPLYQMVFAMQNSAASDSTDTDSSSAGQHNSSEPVDSQLGDAGVDETARTTVRYDLALHIQDSGKGLTACWLYNDTLFHDETIFRLADSYETLLQSIVSSMSSDDVSHSINQLPLLNHSEKQTVMVDWNQTQTDYPANDCLHHLFEKQVRETPNNLAVVFEDDKMSYLELNHRANQLAFSLRAQGVKNGSLVAILMPRSGDMIVAILAVMKTGAAYVPIDPAQPENRTAAILRDCQPLSVLTLQALSNRVPHWVSNLIQVDSAESIASMGKEPRTNLTSSCVIATPDSLAYVIYTSGTTGTPKGIMVSHRNVVNYLCCAKDFQPSQLKGSIVSSGPAFDATISALFLPLLTGRSIELLSEDSSVMEVLADCLSDDSEDHLFKLTPSHLTAMQNGEYLVLNKSSNHLLLIGGEQLSLETFSAISTLLPNSTIMNQYGPSETTVGCCVYTANHIDANAKGKCPPANLPIGKPIANTQLYVLNDSLEIQPVGVTGELYIGGFGVSYGYLNNAALSAENFIPNPFSDVPGQRLYRSGDLVHYLDNGDLQFVKRDDGQVKIRGYRIELQEVEYHLTQCPWIKQALVLAKQGEYGQHILVGYLLPDKEQILQQNTDEQKLPHLVKEYLLRFLPDYSVPSAYVVLDEFPMTTNGKVDKRALPDADKCALRDEQFVAASTDTEKQLVDIWGSLIGLDAEKIGIYASFFGLGGHSLLATRLVSAIRKKFEVEVPLRKIFESPTIAGLSDVIEHSGAASLLPSIKIADRTKPIPLSYSQQRLWFLDQLGGGSVEYNMQGYHLLEGDVNYETFKKALRSLLDRHEVLRTHFTTTYGEPQQLIVNDFILPLTICDLSLLEDTQKHRELQTIVDQEAETPFDLSRDLMLRTRLIKVSKSEHLMLYTLHHIAADGWSRRIFEREFSILYQAHITLTANQIQPLKIQYADYALWQRQWLQGDILTRHLEYWRRQLADLPAVHKFPLDKPRPKVISSDGMAYNTLLDVNLSKQIRTACEQQNVTLFMFLQTAFAILIGRYSNETDIVIGTPISGRVHQDVEGLIGFFVNSLILRTDLSDNPKFADLLQRNKQTILEGYAHQHIPFEMLVEEFRPERNISYNPLYQIVFTVQNSEGDDLDNYASVQQEQTQTQRISKQLDASLRTAVRYDLALHINNTGEALSARWLYKDSLFAEETISRVSRSFEVLVQDILNTLESANDITSKVNHLELIHAQEKQLLLSQWNNTEVPYPQERCLHDLFEQRVQLEPDNIAIIDDEEELTYAQLNRKANQLASYLIQKGVAPGYRLVLGCSRSIDMIVAMLATLKAGAAYVPVDVSQPKNRLLSIIEDCNAQLLLTQSELLAKMQNPHCLAIALDEPQLQASLASCPGDNNEVRVAAICPDYPAYAIYTSGTTGLPKGVLVSHRNIVNYLYHTSSALPVDIKGAVVSSSLAFDATICPIFLPLLQGKSIELLTESNAMMEILTDCLLDDSDSYMFKLTPSHLDAMLAADTLELNAHSKHQLLIGGEQLTQRVLSQCREYLPASLFINQYGPTEATVGCCVYKIEGDFGTTNASVNVPIGKPLSNVKLFVLSEELDLLPVGAAGELYIAGLGLSQGYINGPGLTAEHFVPDPFSGAEGGRLYRTGDLVRYRTDGNLEFIKRIDNQVKVRGYRIEPGEIENALAAQSEIHKAVVSVHQRDKDTPQLVAHVCPSSQYLTETAEAFNVAHVAQWTDVYDNKYGDDANLHNNVDVNFFGWNSSYTGIAIPQQWMEEWQSAIVTEIVQQKPKRLLEIGCGGGLLLYRYAGFCEKVHGLDISAVALAGVQSEVTKRGWHHVTLEQGDALSIDGLAGQNFDTVVVNSVIQYFPNQLYLEEMLKKIIPCVADNGKIIIGDIRNLDLLAPHIAAIETAHLNQAISAAEMASIIQRRIQQEQELLVSPSYFAAISEKLPAITAVDIKVKRGVSDTEMNRFRYDAVLTVGGDLSAKDALCNPNTRVKWFDFESLDAIQDLLDEELEVAIGIASVPNYRIAENCELAAGLSEWHAQTRVRPQQQSGRIGDAAQQQVEALEALLSGAEKRGFHCGITWSQSHLAHLDIIFYRGHKPQIIARSPYQQAYQMNYPQLPTLSHALSVELKHKLADMLPDYMMPGVYIAMEQLPLTTNGKVDMKALPLPEEGDLQKEEYLAPSSDVERKLCELWQELLNIEQVGVNDNFFALGGHSLLATRLVSAIRQEMDAELNLRLIFEKATVKELAGEITIEMLAQTSPVLPEESHGMNDYEEVLL